MCSNQRLNKNFRSRTRISLVFSTILILIDATFKILSEKIDFAYWHSDLYSPGLITQFLEKQSNKYFKNTIVLRKGGQGGPRTIADLPFILDPPFLRPLLLELCSSFSKVLLGLWPLDLWGLPWGSKDTFLVKVAIFAPSEGPKFLFQ